MNWFLICYLVGAAFSFRFSGKWFYGVLNDPDEYIGATWVIAFMYAGLSWVGLLLAWIQGGPKPKIVGSTTTKKVFGIK